MYVHHHSLHMYWVKFTSYKLKSVISQYCYRTFFCCVGFFSDLTLTSVAGSDCGATSKQRIANKTLISKRKNETGGLLH